MKKVLFAIAFTIVTLVATSCKRAETTTTDATDTIAVVVDSVAVDTVAVDTLK